MIPLLAIKTGMTSEDTVARECFPRHLHYTGVMTEYGLDKQVPHTCDGIVSFGLFGGLSPDVHIAQNMCASILHTDKDSYTADVKWRERIFAKTRLYTQPWFSTGEFDLADTEQQKYKLFHTTGAWGIDDESFSVAAFAKMRGIPFIVVRSCSDIWSDGIPMAAKLALKASGGVDILAMLKQIVKDRDIYPDETADVLKLAQQFGWALDSLKKVGRQIGPELCFQ